jgi:hypothetical protein
VKDFIAVFSSDFPTLRIYEILCFPLKAAKLRRQVATATCAGSAKSISSRQAGVFHTNALPV